MGTRRLGRLRRLFDGLVEHRDMLLRTIGREESVQDRQEIRERLIEALSDSSEVLVCEVLERALREEFGLGQKPDPEDD